jgi:hypothetical protein
MDETDIRELAENYCATGKKTPKTGLAATMREWMKSRTGTKTQRRFTIEQMAEALGIAPGDEHQKLRNTLGDFENRKEVKSYFLKKHNRRQYLYCHDWKAELKGKINRKIFKAMYVSQNFAVTDIQRLTGLQDRCWVDKIVRQLKKDAHLQQVQRRRCAHGAGAEIVYRIVDHDKFKLEVMR